MKTLANFKRPKFGTHEELEKYRKTLEDQYNHDYGDNDHKAHVFFKYAEKCTDLSQS
ncbi:MAG TPA: hypothetical protein PKW50_04305 [Syntrophomonas sp.]|nr:hypothetical protein [Syntrophomonas sp.]